MNHLQEIHGGVYLVASPQITAPEDCCVYLVNLGDLILIDTGCGKSASAILENVESLGFSSKDISAVIATHCHIDHIGGIPPLRKRTGCHVIAHELDAPAIETGDPAKTAAAWYNLKFPPTAV